MESGKRLCRSRGEDRLHLHARFLRRLPITCRICRTSPPKRGKPGARQQRRLSDGTEVQTCADRKSTRLNSSHSQISYAVFCLKKKKKNPYISVCLVYK